MAEQHLTSSCHCKAIQLTFPPPKEALNECECTICRRYGALWAYYALDEVKIEGPDSEKYVWGDRDIEFHRCKHCGCVVYWAPIDKSRGTMGVNCQMLDKKDLDRFERKKHPGPP